MIEIYPKKLDGHNCIQSSLENILRYEGYNLPIYKQCSISYVYPKDQLGKLYSDYISLKDEVKWINNIELEVIQYDTASEFIYNLKSLVDINVPVVIYVDPIFLEFSRNYKIKSTIHSITIIGYKSAEFLIVDDVQNFRGSVNINQIIMAAGNAKHKFCIIYFQKSNMINSITDEHVRSAIHMNTKSMMGELEIKIPEVTSELVEIKGIKGIEKFITDYRNNQEEVLKLNVREGQIFEQIYKGLYGMSNCHNLYAEFLSSTDSVNISPYKNQLVEYLLEASQEWKIAAIMVYKAKYKNSKELYLSMLNKVESIIDYEKRIIDTSLKVLD